MGLFCPIYVHGQVKLLHMTSEMVHIFISFAMHIKSFIFNIPFDSLVSSPTHSSREKLSSSLLRRPAPEVKAAYCYGSTGRI